MDSFVCNCTCICMHVSAVNQCSMTQPLADLRVIALKALPQEQYPAALSHAIPFTIPVSYPIGSTCPLCPLHLPNMFMILPQPFFPAAGNLPSPVFSCLNLPNVQSSAGSLGHNFPKHTGTLYRIPYTVRVHKYVMYPRVHKEVWMQPYGGELKSSSSFLPHCQSSVEPLSLHHHWLTSTCFFFSPMLSAASSYADQTHTLCIFLLFPLSISSSSAPCS